jgi:hypothetical protein
LNHAVPTTLYLHKWWSRSFLLLPSGSSTEPYFRATGLDRSRGHRRRRGTNSPTDAASIVPAAFVSIGSVQAGDTVVVDVRMQGDGVGGFQNDIIFDSSVLSLNARDCRINPAIGTAPSAPARIIRLEDASIGP